MTPSRSWGRYTESEVNALLDNYLALRYMRHHPSIHVRLMDLEVAITRHLSRKLKDAVVVYGLLQLTSKAAGEALHISHTAVLKRYRQGVDQIIYTLNGGE